MRTNAAPGLHGSAARAEGKIRSAHEAVSLIRSGDTVATSGFVGIGFAEAIAVALEQRFLASAKDNGMGEPSGLTLVYAAARATARSAASTIWHTRVSCVA